MDEIGKNREKKSYDNKKKQQKENCKKKIISLYETHTIKEIAQKLGIGISTADRYIKELRVEGKISTKRKDFKKCNHNKLLNEQKEKEKKEVLKLCRTKPTKEIALELGITVRKVNQYISELKTEGRLPKEKKNSKKINWDDVQNEEVEKKISREEMLKQVKIYVEKYKKRENLKEELENLEELVKNSGGEFICVRLYVVYCLELNEVQKALKMVQRQNEKTRESPYQNQELLEMENILKQKVNQQIKMYTEERRVEDKKNYKLEEESR